MGLNDLDMCESGNISTLCIQTPRGPKRRLERIVIILHSERSMV
jgi:hypothetical protein